MLPEFGVRRIKAKLDTGARTSSLHAYELTRFRRDGVDMVRFQVHPIQRSAAASVEVVAVVIDERSVRSSAGHEQLRPVVETTVRIGDDEWPIELTLTRRDEMGFRMLLGRQALRSRILVDSAKSFHAGRNANKHEAGADRRPAPEAEEEE